MFVLDRFIATPLILEKAMFLEAQKDMISGAIVPYSMDMIQADALKLLRKGSVSPYQQIFALLAYIPSREWETVEQELEFNGYLLRDRIWDLIPKQRWEND